MDSGMPASVDDRTAVIFAALSHPNRLRILELLRDGERCSCEIQPALGLEQSNLSRHIKLLVSSGILRTRKEGLKLMLRVADDSIFSVITTVYGVLGVNRKARPTLNVER